MPCTDMISMSSVSSKPGTAQRCSSQLQHHKTGQWAYVWLAKAKVLGPCNGCLGGRGEVLPCLSAALYLAADALEDLRTAGCISTHSIDEGSYAGHCRTGCHVTGI